MNSEVAVGLKMVDSSDLINRISSKRRAIKQMLPTFTIAGCEIILEIEVGVVVPFQCIRNKFQVIPITALVLGTQPGFFLQVGGWKKAFKMF